MGGIFYFVIIIIIINDYPWTIEVPHHRSHPRRSLSTWWLTWRWTPYSSTWEPPFGYPIHSCAWITSTIYLHIYLTQVQKTTRFIDVILTLLIKEQQVTIHRDMAHTLNELIIHAQWTLPCHISVQIYCLQYQRVLLLRISDSTYYTLNTLKHLRYTLQHFSIYRHVTAIPPQYVMVLLTEHHRDIESQSTLLLHIHINVSLLNATPTKQLLVPGLVLQVYLFYHLLHLHLGLREHTIQPIHLLSVLPLIRNQHVDPVYHYHN